MIDDAPVASRLGSLPATSLTWRVLRGIKSRTRHQIQRFQSYFARVVQCNSLGRMLKETGCSVDDILSTVKDNLGNRFFCSWMGRHECLDRFRRSFGENVVHEIIRDAEEIYDHCFEFLGTDKVHVGRKIKWRADIATGVEWPSIKSEEVPVERATGSDIIRVWELSRFQWGPTLGKAYWLTGNEKYVKEFFAQVEDWQRCNPYGFGPNWMSSQDVALRAINWIIALGFLGCSSLITRQQWINTISSLYLHGVSVEANLALSYMGNDRTTGTHYLSGLLGLLYLGLLFEKTPKGKSWLEFSARELFFEMSHQVNPDGGDYESSISCYHRFALEHFLSAALLFIVNGIAIPGSFIERLERMFEFVGAYTRPDGTVPQMGDTGDGRVHILSKYATWRRDDHRYLLAVASELWQRNEFKASPLGETEESFWLLDKLIAAGSLPLKTARNGCVDFTRSSAFPDSGFYFMKHKDAYMAISANPVGMKGKGNHKHNDIFSFDLSFGGVPFIIDPGSYVYTSDLDLRHLFRSTKYHNTFQINDYEQNIINRSKPWHVEERAFPRVIRWETNDIYDFFVAHHDGYSRYIDGLIVERAILFDKKKLMWLIQDRVIEDKKIPDDSLFSVFFHCNDLDHCVSHFESPYRIQITKELCEEVRWEKDILYCDTRIELISPEARLTISSSRNNQLRLYSEQGWISDRYGVRRSAPVFRFSGNCVGSKVFAFVLEVTLQ